MTMDPALTAVAISIRKAWRKLAPIRLFLVWNVLHLMLPWPDQRNHRANSVVCGKGACASATRPASLVHRGHYFVALHMAWDKFLSQNCRHLGKAQAAIAMVCSSRLS